MPIGILFHKNRKHDGEGQQAGTAVTQKGERDADDRHQADGHADIDGDMDK